MYDLCVYVRVCVRDGTQQVNREPQKSQEMLLVFFFFRICSFKNENERVQRKINVENEERRVAKREGKSERETEKSCNSYSMRAKL